MLCIYIWIKINILFVMSRKNYYGDNRVNVYGLRQQNNYACGSINP